MFRSAMLAVVLISLTACDKSMSGADIDTSDVNESIAYVLGHDFGQRMAAQDKSLDPEAFAAGFRQGFAGEPSALSKEDTVAAMQQFKQRMQAQAANNMEVAAAENSTQGEKFLAMISEQEGVVTLPSGLRYKVVKEGSGTPPGPTDRVRVHYRGTLVNGEVFDSSYDRGQPAEFPVNGVIKGWTEALQLMKPGATWRLYIPPELAYGDRGAGPKIGPNATLQFEVELLEVVE